MGISIVFYPCEIILTHIPRHTRSGDPYVSSLSKKSVPHRYPCEIRVTNTRSATRGITFLAHDCFPSKAKVELLTIKKKFNVEISAI